MTRLCIKALFLFVLFQWLPINSAAVGSDLVQELIIKSGLKRQIELFPLYVQADLQNQWDLQQLSDEEFKTIYGVIITALDPKAIEKLVHKKIGDHLSNGEIKSILSWLDSPLGKELTRLEEEASKPEAQEQVLGSMEQLITDQEAPDRLRLLQRMEAAFNSTDAAVNMVLDIQIAIVSAISAAIPSPNPLTFDQIVELVNQNRPQLRTQLAEEIISGFLYTYQTVKIADLEQYTVFMESKVGSKYQKVIMNALSDALIESSRKMGESIGRMLNDTPTPSNI